MGRYHTNAEIDRVIDALLRQGWTLRPQGHLYRLLCPCGEGWVRVDGTPRNPGHHARAIKRAAARCPHAHELDGHPRPTRA